MDEAEFFLVLAAPVTFPLRYRVPDFVGGHLTGIMIAERRSNEQDICCHPVLQE